MVNVVHRYRFSSRCSTARPSGIWNEARHDIALAEEPDRPELHRCDADVIVAPTWGSRLAWRPTSEYWTSDARDVRAWIAVVDALVELGRAKEAKRAVIVMGAFDV